MKQCNKILLLLLLTFIGTASVNAQNYQEVVYLQNGDIIRGTVIEQIPNKSVKIQTFDGNILLFPMNDVLRITKEIAVKDNNYAGSNNASVSSGSYVVPTWVDNDEYGWNNDNNARYRGFVGNSVVIGIGDDSQSKEFFYTSHGIQVPWVYIGVGLGFNYWFWGEWGFPVFAHLRTEFHRALKRNISPYIDAKVGYNVGNRFQGFFFAPEFGGHVFFGHSNAGFSFGIGYSMQRGDESYFNNDEFYYNDSYHHYDDRHGRPHRRKHDFYSGISLNIALDF